MIWHHCLSITIFLFFRLKGLAQGLNSELNEHNDLLDRWLNRFPSCHSFHTCQQFKTNFHTRAKYKHILRVIIIFYPMQQFETNFPPGWTTRVKVSVSRWRSKTRRWKRFSKNRKFMSRWCQWWHAIKVSVKRSHTLQRVFKKSWRNVRQDWSQTKLVKNTYLSWKTMCYSSEMGKKSTLDFKWIYTEHPLERNISARYHVYALWKGQLYENSPDSQLVGKICIYLLTLWALTTNKLRPIF